MGVLKRFRFSLRTLLVLLTLASLWLGWHVHESRQQQEAVRAIRNHGGWIRYDFQFPSGSFDYASFDPNAESSLPMWMLDIFGVDLFHSVVEVNLVYSEDGGKRQENNKPSSAALQYLPKFPNLKRLLLAGAQVDDPGMRFLAELPRLEHLYLWDALLVSDDGVDHLRFLKNLRYIHISDSQITDESLKLFGELSHLEGLSLQFNRFTDRGLEYLTSLQNLERLWVCGKDDRPNSITDTGLSSLHHLKKLKELGVQNTAVTSQGVEALKRALANCSVITE